jgi:hypothetical protein
MASVPVRMVTGAGLFEVKITSTTFEESSTPGQVFTIGRAATITALLVAECRVSASTQRLEARITIDGVVAVPGEAVLTANDKYETHSHLCTKDDVPPGKHTVTVEWRVSGGTGFIRKRSFTVWVVR